MPWPIKQPKAGGIISGFCFGFKHYSLQAILKKPVGKLSLGEKVTESCSLWLETKRKV